MRDISLQLIENLEEALGVSEDESNTIARGVVIRDEHGGLIDLAQISIDQLVDGFDGGRKLSDGGH